MTLRLVLVGLVAALGLTIPQWSNSTKRSGSPQAARILRTKDQNKQASVRTVQSRIGEPRGLQDSGVVASTKNPPTGFGAGFVGPNANTHGNFRRVAGNPRPFQLANHAVAANQILKMVPPKAGDHLEVVLGPPAHLKRTPTAFQPIEVPVQLEDGIAFDLNHRAEGVGKLPWPNSMLRNEFRLVRGRMEGLDTFAVIEKIVRDLPPAPVPTLPAEPILTAAVTMLNANADAAMVDLAGKVDQSRAMVSGMTRDLRDHLTMLDVRKMGIVRIATRPVVAELPALPDDVFAPVLTAQAAPVPVAPVLTPVAPSLTVAKVEPAKLPELPDDVFAPTPQTQVALATPSPVVPVQPPVAPESVVAKTAEPAKLPELPDNVFATISAVQVAQAPIVPVLIVVRAVEPAKLPELPDDVFAPAVLSRTQIAAEEPAPEASPLPDDVLASPGSEPVATKVTTQVVKPVDPTSASGEAKALSGGEKRVEKPSRLTSAVALTREAAVAWMKVFSESPVVTMAR